MIILGFESPQQEREQSQEELDRAMALDRLLSWPEPDGSAPLEFDSSIDLDREAA